MSLKTQDKIERILDEVVACMIVRGGAKLDPAIISSGEFGVVLDLCLSNGISVTVSLDPKWLPPDTERSE